MANTPKQPQDHKAPAKDREHFSFEHDGETYTFKSVELLTPGFLRKNRKLDETDQMFTMFELLTDEETLEVIDELSRKEFSQLVQDFYAFLEVSQGE